MDSSLVGSEMCIRDRAEAIDLDEFPDGTALDAIGYVEPGDDSDASGTDASEPDASESAGSGPAAAGGLTEDSAAGTQTGDASAGSSTDGSGDGQESEEVAP